jgi:hypothetical protein
MNIYIDGYAFISTSSSLANNAPSVKAKVKQSHYRPLGFQEVEAPRFLDNQHMKVIRSALRTGRLYSPGDIPVTHFC